MGKRVFIGGLLAFLVACGGLTEDPGGTSSSPAPPPEGEQGLYLPPAGGPQSFAENIGTPSALAMTEHQVVVTTRSTVLAGERVGAGALYVVDKRVGPALLLTVDRQGASFDALAIDGTTAFVATSDARVLAVPIAGGDTTTLATLEAPAVALTTVGEYVYVATSAGSLSRLPKGGGELQPVATVAGAVRGLQADDAAVYVATGAGEGTSPGIARVALEGGAVEVLTSGAEPCAMIREGRRLFWTSLPASPADSTERDKGEVRRLSLEGGEVATVASGPFTACAIAADHDSLYFATTLPAALPVKSGGATTGAGGLGLMRAPIAGGEPVPVVQASRALTQPGAVAVDAAHVYWLTETAVLRLRK